MRKTTPIRKASRLVMAAVMLLAIILPTGKILALDSLGIYSSDLSNTEGQTTQLVNGVANLASEASGEAACDPVKIKGNYSESGAIPSGSGYDRTILWKGNVNITVPVECAVDAKAISYITDQTVTPYCAPMVRSPRVEQRGARGTSGIVASANSELVVNYGPGVPGLTDPPITGVNASTTVGCNRLAATVTHHFEIYYKNKNNVWIPHMCGDAVRQYVDSWLGWTVENTIEQNLKASPLVSIKAAQCDSAELLES